MSSSSSSSCVVSCFTNCYGSWGVWTAVEKVRAAGVGALELALRGHNLGGLVIPESAVITEKADDALAEKFCRHLETHGVKVSGCNVGGADIRTLDGVELTERRIRFAAKWFGISVVVSGAGHPENEGEKGVLYDNLRRLGDCAGELGVTIALETHKGLTQNAQAMLDLLENVRHPRVQLNFDTGNIAYYNPNTNPVDELSRVAEFVRNVHVKDNRGLPEDWYFPALGDGGAVNFRAVRETLEAVGYSGAYTIEIEGILGEPEPGLDGRQERIARSAAHLKACGYPTLSAN